MNEIKLKIDELLFLKVKKINIKSQRLWFEDNQMPKP